MWKRRTLTLEIKFFALAISIDLSLRETGLVRVIRVGEDSSRSGELKFCGESVSRVGLGLGMEWPSGKKYPKPSIK